MVVDSVTGEILNEPAEIDIYPAKHYITQEERLKKAINDIEEELESRLGINFKKENRLLEAQRLEQRTRYDLEMLQEVGYCAGVENYSRHLDQRPEGSHPLDVDGLHAQ